MIYYKPKWLGLEEILLNHFIQRSSSISKNGFHAKKNPGQKQKHLEFPNLHGFNLGGTKTPEQPMEGLRSLLAMKSAGMFWVWRSRCLGPGSKQVPADQRNTCNPLVNSLGSWQKCFHLLPFRRFLIASKSDALRPIDRNLKSLSLGANAPGYPPANTKYTLSVVLCIVTRPGWGRKLRLPCQNKIPWGSAFLR